MVYPGLNGMRIGVNTFSGVSIFHDCQEPVQTCIKSTFLPTRAPCLLTSKSRLLTYLAHGCMVYIFLTTVLHVCYMLLHLYYMSVTHVIQAGHAVTMLSEQYRMHPAISAWPSLFFYQGKLSDATSALPGAVASRAADFHKRPCFPPLAFFDCR